MSPLTPTSGSISVRFGHSSTFLNAYNSIITIGGLNNNGYLSDVEVFELASSKLYLFIFSAQALGLR